MGSQAAPTKVVSSQVTATETLIPQPTHILVATSVLANPISPLVNESSFQPGIYPVIYISSADRNYAEDISSGNPQSFADIGKEDSILSPDGNSVIYMDYDQLWESNFVTGAKHKVPQPELNAGGLQWIGNWSPDGKYLVYEISPQTWSSDENADEMALWGYYVADLENNQFIKIANWVLTVHSPIWSPDGKWIAFLSMPKDYSSMDSSNDDLYLFNTNCLNQIKDCQQDSVIQLTNVHSSGWIGEMSWSPDSRKIVVDHAYFTQMDDIYTVDLQGHMINLTNTPNILKDAISWSPRGDELVFRSGKGTVMYGELQLLSLKNGSLTMINDSPDQEYVGEPKWSPDGNYIAYTNETSDSSSDIVKVYSINQKKNFILSAGSNYDYEFATWLSILPPFQVGTVFKVSPYGNNLNLHDKPSLSSTVLSKLPADQVLTIIAGPVQADDYTWWQVKAGDLTGWVAQVPLWYLANNPLVIDGQ
jgi:Tol biopolymer transport system component